MFGTTGQYEKAGFSSDFVARLNELPAGPRSMTEIRFEYREPGDVEIWLDDHKIMTFTVSSTACLAVEQLLFGCYLEGAQQLSCTTIVEEYIDCTLMP